MTEQNMRTLPAFTKLFYVKRTDESMATDVLFERPGPALLWALLTTPGVNPTFNLGEEDTDSDFMSIAGRKYPAFRYPNRGGFRLMEVSLPSDLTFSLGIITDDDIAIAISIGKSMATLYYDTGSSVVAGESFEGLSIEAAMEQIVDMYDRTESGSRPYQIITTEDLRAKTLKLVGQTAYPSFSYAIKWEAVWEQFVDYRSKGNNLQQTSDYFNSILTDVKENSKFIAYGSPPGYDNCSNGLRGLRNSTGTSCFMDSTLMAMFAFKRSPYRENLLRKPHDPSQSDLPITRVCSDDPIQDSNLRQEIRNLLVNDVNIMFTGNVHECSTLRTLLGRTCRMSEASQDLSLGLHDPSEFYGRLLNALAYNPIMYTETTTRASDAFGSNAVVSNRRQLSDVFLPSLNVNNVELTSISWPSSWNTDSYELIEDDNLEIFYLNRHYDIDSAECVVVYLDRRDIYGDATRLNDRYISIDVEFDVNDEIYDLSAIVYSPYDGHFATILRCGKDWYNYDDTKIDTYVSENMMDPREVKGIISTRGVMFFYYKGFVRDEYMDFESDSEVDNSSQHSSTLSLSQSGESFPIGPPSFSNVNPLSAMIKASSQISTVGNASSRTGQSKPMTMLTLNVSYNTMNNTVAGSDATHVAKCQAMHPLTDINGDIVEGYDGWFSTDKDISTCSVATASFIAKFDIFALQEVDEKKQDRFEEIIQYYATEGHKIDVEVGDSTPDRLPVYKFLTGEKGLVVGYDETAVGSAIVVKNLPFPLSRINPAGLDRRSFMLVYFPKLKMLFGNIHSPRLTNLKYELDVLFAYLESIMKDAKIRYMDLHGTPMVYDRVVLAGDFNDYTGSLNGVEIEAFGKVLSIPTSSSGQPIKSCCTDSDFQYPGDYIMDSARHILGTYHYGYNIGYNRGNPLMSDHDPIVLLDQ